MRVGRSWSPAEQIERRLVTAGLQYLGEILLLGLRHQVYLDADTGQHADDRLADRGIVDIAVVGAIHANFKTVGVSGFRQKLLGAVGIEFRPSEILGKREQLWCDHQRRRRRKAAHHAGLDQLDVDGLVEGLANPDVLEGVLALHVRVQQFIAHLVHAEEQRAQFRTGHDLGVAARVHPLNILDRHRLDDIDFAREQGGDAGGVGGDRGEDDFLQIMFRLAPPGRVRLEHGLDAGLVALDEEGPGAVFIERGVARRGCGSRRRRHRVVLFAPLLVHDEPAIPLRDQDGIRRRQNDIDGVVVDLDELGVGRNDAGEVGALGSHPLG